MNIEQSPHAAPNGTRQGASAGERESASSEARALQRDGQQDLAAELRGGETNNMGAEEDKDMLTRLRESIGSPTGGAVIAGTIGLGAATLFGVVETLVGVGAALGVYRLVCKRQQPRSRPAAAARNAQSSGQGQTQR
jgi:hypothetical protein